VRDDAAGDREEREAHPLGARGLHRGRQRQPLHRRQDVVGQQTQPVPRRVRAEASAGRNGRRQIVLRHVVHVLDRARLLPVPADELGGRELASVADDGEVLRVVATAEQVPLLLADAQRHLARPSPKRFAAFFPADLTPPAPLSLSGEGGGEPERATGRLRAPLSREAHLSPQIPSCSARQASPSRREARRFGDVLGCASL